MRRQWTRSYRVERNDSSMRVIVVDVGSVIVRMHDPVMWMPMRVLADHRRVVRVIVMPIVVPMSVLVLGGRRCPVDC